MNKKRFGQIFSFLCAAVLMMCNFAIVPASAKTDKVFSSVKELNQVGLSVGVETGSSTAKYVEENYTNVKVNYYDDVASAILALKKGDIEFVVYDGTTLEMAVHEDKDLALLPDAIRETPRGMVFQKGSGLAEEFSKVIDRFIADGVVEEMEKRWLSFDAEFQVIPSEVLEKNEKCTGKTIIVMANYACAPFEYVGNGGIVTGYEVEMVYRVANELNYKVSLSAEKGPTLIPSLTAGKSDIAIANLNITKEREEVVDFCTSFFTEKTKAIMLKENVDKKYWSDLAKSDTFWGNFKYNFQKAFIREDRWKVVLNGLLNTVIITAASSFIGTLLGFLLCFLYQKKISVINSILRGISVILGNVPLLVVVMIAYYILFGNSERSPVFVSIVVLSVTFAFTVMGHLNRSVENVSAGQWEAATALGLRKNEVFFKIILKQAMRIFLPLYQDAFVSLMLSTSVLAYISVNDLTRAADIIRTRTYEAFFPIIATAIIYFALALLVARVIKVVINLNKEKPEGKRVPKGVTYINPDDIILDDSEDEKNNPANREILVTMEHVKKVYPEATPLIDVNTVIRRGDAISIIGPSGTGKSTLMRMINRLETHTEGTITVFGQNVTDKNTDLCEIRRKVGMVFQSFNLFDNMTVVENIMFAPMLLLKTPRQEAYENALRLLKRMGLAEKQSRYPDELSGGQKQRVAIARTLAMKPDMILFDEPTSALDPAMVGEVESVIADLIKAGQTIMLVTHDMHFAKSVSTRVFYMDEGIIYEDGTPEEIFDHPKKAGTKAFVEKLKNLTVTIDSDSYDYPETIRIISNFCDKQHIPYKKEQSVLSIFDEVCSLGIVPKTKKEPPLFVNVLCSDEGEDVTVIFEFDGDKSEKPQDDALEMRILSLHCSSLDFEYIDKRNRITAKVK